MNPIERRRAEIELLRRCYETVDVQEPFECVIIRKLPLPQGWSRAETDVLFMIPSGYPTTPPDNFYVAPPIRLESGAMPSNYKDGGLNRDGKTWCMFSYHPDSGWRPGPEPNDGSNLLTFMALVERRLSELN